MYRSSEYWMILLTFVLNFVMACTIDHTEDPLCPDYPCQPDPIIITPPDIATVPDTLFVDSRSYIIECFLWRDFMPICPADGTHLIAHIKVVAMDSLEIPVDLDATYLWMFKDGGIWGSHFTDERNNWAGPFELIRIARCGPRWQTGIIVDVIVRVMIGGKHYYLKEKDVYIYRTE